MRSSLRRLLALVLAVATASVIAACGDDETRGGSGAGAGTPAARTGGELLATYSVFPDSLDPALSYTQEGWQALWVVYTPLLTYQHDEGTEGAQLIPGLAESLPDVSEDGRTYRLRLRDGLTFSDGTPVKASDFEHSIKRVLNLESGGSSFFLGIEGAEEYVERGRARGDISGIETNDETGEITIRLKEPDGSFPYVLAMNFAAVVPGDTPFQDMTKDPPPGVGPFVLERVRQSRGFDLVRNPNWQEIDGIPSARLDRIRVDVRTSDRRQAQDVMRNRVDYMFDPPPADQLREVRARYADRYEEFVTNSTYYFFLNTKVPPFDRKEVRQAVNLAIDKRALSRLFGGMLEPTCNFLPPDMQGHRRIDPCPYGDPMEEPDLEQAREFVRRAGAEGARVDVYGHAEEPSRPVVEYLADTLGRIGLKARPKLIDPEVYFETIGNQRTKAQIGFANWFQDFPHPRNFLLPVDPSAIQQTNNQNYSNVDDDEIRARLKEANALPLEDAAPLYEEIDRRLIDEAYVAPYGHRKLASFFSDRVDVERCTVTHPVYQLDFSQLCLK